MKYYDTPELIFPNAVINTSLSESDIVSLNEAEEATITIVAVGSFGDNDVVEVYQINSNEGIAFETLSVIEKIFEFNLLSNSLVRKMHKLTIISPYLKIGVRMRSGSTETPLIAMAIQKIKLLCN